MSYTATCRFSDIALHKIFLDLMVTTAQFLFFSFCAFDRTSPPFCCTSLPKKYLSIAMEPQDLRLHIRIHASCGACRFAFYPGNCIVASEKPVPLPRTGTSFLTETQFAEPRVGSRHSLPSRFSVPRIVMHRETAGSATMPAAHAVLPRARV